MRTAGFSNFGQECISMRIGIIGAGHIGGTLTRRLAALGHEVVVANMHGPDSLAELTKESGAKAVSVTEAVKGRDLIVISIPVKNIPKLPNGLLANVPKHVPVIDTGNYYPQQRDGHIREIEDGQTETRWASNVVGHPLIKVFNNIYAQHLLERGVPKGTAGRIALPVAGDDEAAKAIVLKLVDDLGFDPVDAGGIDESWRQQPGSPGYGKDFDAARLKQALADAKPERPHDFRGAAA
ncbi:MAG TPA: NAD(P)-binding domain-containing protein [Bauldia sp.]|nr:NAD(P)-binding domain-containing protein [Bauldia sp.]